MNTQQYWVVGGRYNDMSFSRVVDGTQRIEGPFNSYTEAEQAWKAHTNDTRSDACMRYTIVACAPNPRRQAA
jgi:hypothetical protein